jgi:hypothetical protein
MKNWVLTLLLVVLAVPAVAQDYSSARELIQASYEKTGGDKWKQVETMAMSSTMSIETPQGDLFGSMKFSFKYPGYTHMKLLLDIPEEMGGPPGGMTQVNLMRPDTTLIISDMGGSQGAPGGQGPKAATEELAMLNNESLDLSIEKGELDSASVYIVTSVEDSLTSKIYYDSNSLFRIARAVQTPQGEAMVYYGDYRNVDGLMLPYLQRQSMMGMNQTMKVKSYEINATIDDALFEISGQ